MTTLQEEQFHRIVINRLAEAQIQFDENNIRDRLRHIIPINHLTLINGDLHQVLDNHLPIGDHFYIRSWTLSSQDICEHLSYWDDDDVYLEIADVLLDYLEENVDNHHVYIRYIGTCTLPITPQDRHQQDSEEGTQLSSTLGDFINALQVGWLLLNRHHGVFLAAYRPDEHDRTLFISLNTTFFTNFHERSMPPSTNVRLRTVLGHTILALIGNDIPVSFFYGTPPFQPFLSGASRAGHIVCDFLSRLQAYEQGTVGIPTLQTFATEEWLHDDQQQVPPPALMIGIFITDYALSIIKPNIQDRDAIC
ncbi:hypothetical protein BDA99DRAFT_557338 [Phascolomyces articulosus]|uniref:Uncharacterized protein n=1 Tax=Phascolomyces articulosus TaxID=60185 RepID=A0AAD5PGV1_9FUNG|nr:hypothetical protein BDA99DRAFT_557338 [Phascolomyces articulosus]